MAPSTFASAAAASSANSTRTDSGGDWSRRANGATQTFRRTSHATSASGTNASGSTTHSRETSNAQNPIPNSNAGVYIPPHAQANRNGGTADTRYSRDQLLQLFKDQKEAEELKDGLSSLYVAGWEPNIQNGASNTPWGRREDNGRETQPGADICWDREGSVQPLGLVEMTEEEKEHFSTSVNSPLKPPVQNANKEGTPKDGLSLRKTSISQAQSPAGFGLASPTTNRQGNRRRDVSDSYPFPTSSTNSPSTSRFNREEGSNPVAPPPSLIRRRTDLKDAATASKTDDRDEGKPKDSTVEAGAGLPSFKRTATAPFGASLGPTSPWSATPGSGGYTPMGAFGSFALGTQPSAATTPSGKTPGLGSIRGESRFKGLMAKDSSEDMSKASDAGKPLREKSSLASLGKTEPDTGRQTPSWMEARANRPLSNDTDPFPDEEFRTGSAALGGGQDISPPYRSGMPGFGTPQRQGSGDDGFSAFGMTADNTGLAGMFHRDPYSQTPQHRGMGGNEPMSPTDTNPYQSPEHEKHDTDDVDTNGSDIQHAHLPSLGGLGGDQGASSGMGGFGGLGGLGRVPNAYEVAASDRSQTSSVGPSRGFPSLGGIGGLPGLGGASAWSTAGQPSVGTPIRERAFGGFGDGLFGSVGEMHSPSLSGLGSNSLFTPGGTQTGTIGRSSKLGSLFPPAMQEQMRSNDQNRQGNDDGNDGPFGRNAFGNNTPGSMPTRETSSPFRSGQNLFEGLLGSNRNAPTSEAGFNEPIGTPFGQPATTSIQTPSTPAAIGQSHDINAPPSVGSSASNQPPPAQQRTMVMPDRMRWIYRDPQGVTQGPWSGLEMHDWYKAGFFSPELLVKKLEDPDYEPLAQLIRRIGNSREPFLVPQIGIPHGAPNTQPGTTWPTAGLTSGLGSSAAAQPPFAGSFPSFGTTLTAEQQNALERRKQEEQYLMARQKDYLAQQQILAKQGHILPQLHHHSSAHSLHSQPSFGSITSPSTFQPTLGQGPLPGGPAVPGFFDNSFRPAPVPGLGPIGAVGMDVAAMREEEIPGLMERLNLGRGGQLPFGGAPAPFGHQQQPDSNAHAQQVAAMLQDRSRLQREQAEHDSAQQRLGQSEQQQQAQASADRLREFQELKGQEQPSAIAPPGGVIGKPSGPTTKPTEEQKRQAEEMKRAEPREEAESQAAKSKPAEPLSLTEQVQKAQSAKQAPAQSPWAKVDPSLPHPFPPPQSSSPLPAPAAQRKQNVADTLNAESRSRSQTPSVETPTSIAPWAKEPVEAPKGPSLKEIQEAEAKKAAQAEAAAAAARREAMEKELMAQAAAPPPAPGLPSSSTWASNASPVNASATPSAWNKAAAAVKTPGTPVKKTLQQIQKEEESRKLRAAAAAAASAATNATATASPAPTTILSSGKRYADLAGKSSPAPSSTASPAAGGAWTTVGASGKVKAPVPPTGPAAGTRAASSTATPVAATAKPKPIVTQAPTKQQLQANAQEEFKKWAMNELKGDLNAGLKVEDIVSGLLQCPPEAELLTEAIHGVSQTIDSRHFAEEFLRRRKLADKGIVDTSSAVGSPASERQGGWSEVAKKGSVGSSGLSGGAGGLAAGGLGDVGFKVVAPKGKRGGRK